MLVVASPLPHALTITSINKQPSCFLVEQNVQTQQFNDPSDIDFDQEAGTYVT